MRVSISMPHWMEAAWVSMGFMSDGFGLRGSKSLRTSPWPRHRPCRCRTVLITIWLLLKNPSLLLQSRGRVLALGMRLEHTEDGWCGDIHSLIFT